MSRKPRLVCLDVDGTLVGGFSPSAPFIWRVLHDSHGSPQEPLERKRRSFFAGKCTYAEWFEHDLVHLRAGGATRESLTRAIRQLRPMDNAAELIRDLQAAGIRVAILSGSVDLVLEAFFPELTFDAVFLNRFSFDDEGRLAGGTPTPYDIEAKALGLRTLAAEMGIPLQETAFVGDAHNDVEVARIAGLSIAFNCQDPELAAVANHVFPAPTTDLGLLRPLLLGTR